MQLRLSLAASLLALAAAAPRPRRLGRGDASSGAAPATPPPSPPPTGLPPGDALSLVKIQGPKNGGGGGRSLQVEELLVPTDLRNKCEEVASAVGGNVTEVFNEFNECVVQSKQGDTFAMGSLANVQSSEVFENYLLPETGEEEAADASEDLREQRNVTDTGRRLYNPFAPDEWGLDRVDQCSPPLDGATTKADAAGVRVYIVDTGVKGTHEDLRGSMAPQDSDCHFSAFSSSPDPWDDVHGHGTHVAGTACGDAYGIAENCEVCAVKVLDANGSGNSGTIIAGLNHILSQCHDRKCVANLSLGGGTPHPGGPSWQAYVMMADMGVVTVVAAGNSNVDACTVMPAGHPDVITVGSTRYGDGTGDPPSGFSSYGGCVDIYAPGSDILSAGTASDTASRKMSGTSMASPMVAGIAAQFMRLRGAMWDTTHSSAEFIKEEILDSAYRTGISKPPFSEYEIIVANIGLGCNDVPTSAPTSCDEEYSLVRVAVTTDSYGIETRWELVEECGGTLVALGLFLADNTAYTREICTPRAKFRFTIKDDYGDGICCASGPGNYRVELDGVVVGEDDSVDNNWIEKTHEFGECPNATPEPTDPPTPSPTASPTTQSPTLRPIPPPTQPPTHPPFAIDEAIDVNLFQFKFSFAPEPACDHTGGVLEGESPHQCATACAMLGNCVGFVRPAGGLDCVLHRADDDHSCSSDAAQTSDAMFYKRTVDMRFEGLSDLLSS